MQKSQRISLYMFATRLLVLMAAVFFLSACVTSPIPTAEQTPVPTDKAVPSDTPQPVETLPEITQTFAPQPTFTLWPTVTLQDADAGQPIVKVGVAYIGKENPPDPAGYPLNAGWMLMADMDHYAVTHYQTEDRTRALIFLERYLRRDTAGHAYFLIVDAVEITNIPAGQRLISDCHIDDVLRDDVILMGADDPAEFGRVIALRAWTVDLPNERLIEVDPSTIDCRFEAQGYVPGVIEMN